MEWSYKSIYVIGAKFTFTRPSSALLYLSIMGGNIVDCYHLLTSTVITYSGFISVDLVIFILLYGFLLSLSLWLLSLSLPLVSPFLVLLVWFISCTCVQLLFLFNWALALWSSWFDWFASQVYPIQYQCFASYMLWYCQCEEEECAFT